MEANKKDNRTDDDKNVFRAAVIFSLKLEKETELNSHISQEKNLIERH